MINSNSSAFSKIHRGFSLVEVVLAVGILSFSIIVVGGLYGNLISRHNDNSDRQEIARAVTALNEYLERPDSSALVSGWLPSIASEKELNYVVFRAGTEGQPDPTSDRLTARWIGGRDNEPTENSLDAARQGSWIRAVLKQNEELAATASRVLNAELFDVPSPDHELSADAVPLLVVPIVVTP